MKKIFLFSAVLISAAQAITAQNIALTDRIGQGALEVLPKELTSSKNQSLMQVYNFKDTKETSELMIAASREDVKKTIPITNAENAHEYWLKNVGGNWVPDNEHTYFYIPYTDPLLGFYYQDPDNSFYPTATIMASQNVFNSDDNWEYVLLDIENKERAEIVDGSYFGDDIQRKQVEQTKTIKGYKIYNQNGMILNIPVAEIKNENKYIEDAYGYNLVKFDGLLYMTTIEMVRRTDDGRLEEAIGMYVINTSTTKVISASRTTGRVNVSGGSGIYNIKVENAQDGEKVILTDMSGKTIGSAPASEGLSFQSIGTGIYNITLSSDKVEENLKFLGK